MEVINKQKVAYGFISVTSASYPEDVMGERLGELFMAIDDYEKYLEEHADDNSE